MAFLMSNSYFRLLSFFLAAVLLVQHVNAEEIPPPLNRPFAFPPAEPISEIPEPMATPSPPSQPIRSFG